MIPTIILKLPQLTVMDSKELWRQYKFHTGTATWVDWLGTFWYNVPTGAVGATARAATCGLTPSAIFGAFTHHAIDSGIGTEQLLLT